MSPQFRLIRRFNAVASHLIVSRILEVYDTGMLAPVGRQVRKMAGGIRPVRFEFTSHRQPI